MNERDPLKPCCVHSKSLHRKDGTCGYMTTTNLGPEAGCHDELPEPEPAPSPCENCERMIGFLRQILFVITGKNGKVAPFYSAIKSIVGVALSTPAPKPEPECDNCDGAPDGGHTNEPPCKYADDTGLQFKARAAAQEI